MELALKLSFIIKKISPSLWLHLKKKKKTTQRTLLLTPPPKCFPHPRLVHTSLFLRPNVCCSKERDFGWLKETTHVKHSSSSTSWVRQESYTKYLHQVSIGLYCLLSSYLKGNTFTSFLKENALVTYFVSSDTQIPFSFSITPGYLELILLGWIQVGTFQLFPLKC